MTDPNDQRCRHLYQIRGADGLCNTCRATGGVIIPAASKLLPCTDIITEIAAERRRQIEVEGWTPAHDDAHGKGEMAQAAALYATPPDKRRRCADPRYGMEGWPSSWHPCWWKPKSRRRDLVRAAALIVAEIERLDRLERKGGAA